MESIPLLYRTRVRVLGCLIGSTSKCTFNVPQIASFHRLRDLSEPQFTHEFY